MDIYYNNSMDQQLETKQAADFFRTEYQKLVGFVKKKSALKMSFGF